MNELESKMAEPEDTATSTSQSMPRQSTPDPTTGIRELSSLKLSGQYKWYKLGLQLGIEEHILDRIEENYPRDSDMRQSKMFGAWLRSDTEASWSKLCEALMIVKEDKLVESISSEYGPLSLPAHDTSSSVSHQIPQCIADFAKVVKEAFCEMEVLPDEDWPPSIGRHESNLVLIEHPRHPLPGEKEVEEILKDYVGGNVDKIVEEKQEIKYEKVFGFLKPQDNPKFKFKMLIDGAPGVGKTVLCRRFCKDWAAGEILEEFPLVWLLHLRDPAIAKAEFINDLFQHYDEDLLKEVVQYIKKKGGAGNLLIFDGLDELSKQERTQCSLFLDIIRGRALPNCSVVVTSRPYASQQLQEMKIINRHVEVVGFTKDQIKECISQNITENAKAEQLIQALKQRLDVLSLCYTPLNCAIMLYIYQQEDYQLPKTLTQLYTLYMIHTLKRSVSIHFQDLDPDDITDLKRLKEPIDIPFRALSKMAFQGLQDEQLGFTTDQLPQECKGGISGTKPELLGLMSASKFFSSSGRSLNYQFTHLTVQEFLAARHAATRLSVGEQNRLFQEKWNDERFRMMLLLLSGISGLEDKQMYLNTLRKVHVLPKQIYIGHVPLWIIDQDVSFFVAHQLYESRNTSLSLIIAKSLQRILLHILDRFQCTVFTYFLSTCKFKWRCLDLRGITPQILEIMKNKSCAGSSKSQTDEKCIPLLESTHCLELSCEWAVCDNPQSLSCIFNMKQLTSFNVSYPGDYGSYVGHLEKMSFIEFLYYMFKALEHNTTLQKLKLSLSLIGFEKKEMEAFTNMLQTNTSLKQLILHYLLGHEINGDLLAKHIAAGLVENRSLKALNVGFMSASEEVASIFRALERNNTLETLHMHFPFGSETALPFDKALCSMLLHNNTLTELNMARCNLTPTCCTALFSGLEKNSSLKKLNLHANEVGQQTSTSEAFGDMLSCNHSLTELDIAHCNFHQKHVARGLLNNTTVKKLKCSKAEEQSIVAALIELRAQLAKGDCNPEQDPEVKRCAALLSRVFEYD